MRTTFRSIRRATPLAIATTLALVAGACGSDDDDPVADDPIPTEATPVTEAAPVTQAADADATPERIVSLSPTATEMMFAIGADDLLVAVDEFSDHPDAALELPNDLSGFEPNVEAIAAFEPDLVLIGGDFTGLGDQLGEIDIDSLDLPVAATIDDTYRQIEQLGTTTGRVAEASDVVADMRSRVEEIIGAAGGAGASLSYYHELDPTYFSLDSTTFVGELYALLGLTNIADADTSESFGYPQLNAESIIDANPDLIFLADTKCCGETAETVAARPGWDAIAAVQDGNVIEMDDDIASRWGPRIVDYLAAVADAVANVGAES